MTLGEATNWRHDGEARRTGECRSTLRPLDVARLHAGTAERRGTTGP